MGPGSHEQLKSGVTKRTACYKPGYKVRTGVREGQFAQKRVSESPSPSLPRMERGGVRSHRELPSPISGRAAGGRVAAPALPTFLSLGMEFIGPVSV